MYERGERRENNNNKYCLPPHCATLVVWINSILASALSLRRFYYSQATVEDDFSSRVARVIYAAQWIIIIDLINRCHCYEDVALLFRFA